MFTWRASHAWRADGVGTNLGTESVVCSRLRHLGVVRQRKSSAARFLADGVEQQPHSGLGPFALVRAARPNIAWRAKPDLLTLLVDLASRDPGVYERDIQVAMDGKIITQQSTLARIAGQNSQ